MPRDLERIERVQSTLDNLEWDALVCARPSNVLLLSGYWPVTGTSIAIATREGKLGLIVPDDERELAHKAAPDELETFETGSLKYIAAPDEKACASLTRLVKQFNIQGTCGFEHEAAYEPTSYVGVHSYSGTLQEMLSDTIPVNFVPADKVLTRLRASLTPCELERIRIACRIAERAYRRGAAQLYTGLMETEAAAAFRAPLSDLSAEDRDVERADGYAYCMSGPNSAEAFAAFQRSRGRPIESGDFVLIHCNSCADGYWTDVTRTYFFGEPDTQVQRMYDAVFAARAAALRVIKPGVKAAEVDRVAREVMRSRGFDQEFKHPTGHGVGFSAINHLARPRLHPASNDLLERGMVFNVEPGVYIAGYGGLRHCDMVAVTETGAEVITRFQEEMEELIFI